MITFAKHPAGYLEWGTFVVFGLVLILLAVPRFAAAYYRLGAAPAVYAITENKEVISEAKLIDAAKKLVRASLFTSQNRTVFNNRATIDLALYEQYKSKGDSDRAFAALSHARGSLQDALKAAPGDANLWYLLAETRARLSGADKKTNDFLHLSYLTGNREGWVARRRLGLSLRLWPILSEETRKMVRREIHIMSGGSYRNDLARYYLGSTVAGKEAVTNEISRKGENEKTRFLNLVKKLKKNN